MPGRIGTLLTDLRSRCTGTGKVRHSRRAVGCGGFSLLEVLVALAILGIGLGVIFQGIAQGLRLRGSAAESVRLALVAERILGALPERAAAPEQPEEGEESDCRWRLETVSGAKGWTGASPAAGAKVPEASALAEVRLTVTGRSGRAWVMTTLLPLAPETRK